MAWFVFPCCENVKAYQGLEPKGIRIKNKKDKNTQVPRLFYYRISGSTSKAKGDAPVTRC
ncbi:hypothetical protein PGB90_000114 [Kerria lacca]